MSGSISDASSRDESIVEEIDIGYRQNDLRNGVMRDQRRVIQRGSNTNTNTTYLIVNPIERSSSTAQAATSKDD